MHFTLRNIVILYLGMIKYNYYYGKEELQSLQSLLEFIL